MTSEERESTVARILQDACKQYGVTVEITCRGRQLGNVWQIEPDTLIIKAISDWNSEPPTLKPAEPSNPAMPPVVRNVRKRR